jgi:hypothetical protein
MSQEGIIMETRKIVIMGDNGEQKTIELPADFDMSILEKAAAPKRVRKSSKVEYKLDETHTVQVTTNEKQNIIFFNFPNGAMCFLNIITKKMYHGNNGAEFLPTHLNELISELPKKWECFAHGGNQFLKNLFRILDLLQNYEHNHYEKIKIGKITHLIENLDKYEKIAKHPITNHLDDIILRRIATSKVDYLQFADKWFMDRLDETTAATYGNYKTHCHGPRATFTSGMNFNLSTFYFGYIRSKRDKMDDYFRHVWDNYRMPLYTGDGGSQNAIEWVGERIKIEGFDRNRLFQYLFVDLPAQGKSYNGDFEEYTDTYRDYITMITEVSPDNYDKYPRYLATAHDIVAQNYSITQSEKLDKDFGAQVNAHSDLAWDDKSEDFVIVVPKTPSELGVEGGALSHCVASYAVRVAAGETMVVFMRDRKEIDKPLVTIQVNNYNIQQSKGFGNRLPNKEQLEFIGKYKEQLEKVKNASSS